MAYNSLELLAHALIIQYLEINKYEETLSAFRRESYQLINDNPESFSHPPSQTLTEILFNLNIDNLSQQTKALSIEREEDAELNIVSENIRIPTTLVKTFDTIHAANILTVRLHDVSLAKTILEEEKIIPTIVTSSADKSIQFTSLVTGKILQIFEIHNTPVLCIDFHPKFPELMLTGSTDASCALVNIRDGTILQSWKNHTKFVVHALFSPDGCSFVTASYDRSVSIYKIKVSDPASSTSSLPCFEHVHKIGPYLGNVECLTFVPDSNIIVLGVRDDNYLHYVDLGSPAYTDTKYNMNANGDDWISFTPMYLSVSPDGKYILVSTDNQSGRLILFRLHTARQVRNFYGAPTDNFSIPRHCWHPNSKHFYVTGDDWKIRVFEVASAKVVGELIGHSAVIRGLWFDSAKNILLSCGFDKTVRIWGLNDTVKL